MPPQRQRRPQPAEQDTAMVAGTSQGGALVTVQQYTQTVQQDINSRLDELTKALAGRYDPAWFTSAALSQFRRTPALWEASKSVQGRVSIVASVIEAAQVGLPFLMGRAYLVPFRNHGVAEAQLIIGYQGLVDKVTGPTTGVTYVEAAVVYARDRFEYMRGTDGYLRHREYEPEIDPDSKAPLVVDRGQRTHVWARVVFANGQDRWEVFKIDQIEVIRQGAASAKAASSPWVTNYDEMAKKTVLRNITKTLRIDFQLMQLLDREDQFEGGHTTTSTDTGQAALRRQLQQRLAPEAADSAPEQPEGGEAKPEAPAVDSGPEAQPEGAQGQPPPLWPEGASPEQVAKVCGHQALSPDKGSTYTCTLAPRHGGKMHSDGLHDWPAGA